MTDTEHWLNVLFALLFAIMMASALSMGQASPHEQFFQRAFGASLLALLFLTVGSILIE